MKKSNLAFIDVETTGMDPEKHEIIEIACLVASQNLGDDGKPQFQVLEEFDFKVKPAHIETAESEALLVNRYNEMDWLFAVDLPKALEDLSRRTEGAIMVAQNVAFDFQFLNKAFSQTGIENKMHFYKLDLISIAFAKLYKDERVTKYNLWALAEHFGLSNEKAHSAMADVRMTFEIYKKLISL